MRHRRSKTPGQTFWDREYRQGDHLALSENASEDLIKFARYLERERGHAYLNPLASVIDLGCGNGRNLIYFAKTFGMKGIGYDISNSAVLQAKQVSHDLPLSYEVRSIALPIRLPNASQTLALDMMTSHFLTKERRYGLYQEIYRVLKPQGWLFLKTLLLDEDIHAMRLLREYPGKEAGTYIHPKIGVAEYVGTEKEIVGTLRNYFTIHKVLKSHRHRDKHGNANKRRSISIYAQKNP